MNIRPISVSDLDGLVELFVACFSAPPWSENWSISAGRARISSMLQAESCRGVVAVLDGAIIGMAFGQIEGWLNANLFVLQEFCVVPSCQNKGIGKALLADLLPRLAEEHVGSFYLLTDHASPAYDFYTKFGFVTSSKKVVMGAAISTLMSKAKA